MIFASKSASIMEILNILPFLQFYLSEGTFGLLKHQAFHIFLKKHQFYCNLKPKLAKMNDEEEYKLF